MKLDEEETAKVRLRDFEDGWICVGKRKVSCAFLPSQAENAWVYCTKSTFLKIVSWVSRRGLDLDSDFFVVYTSKMLTPMTETEVAEHVNRRKEIALLLHGPAQGTT